MLFDALVVIVPFFFKLLLERFPSFFSVIVCSCRSTAACYVFEGDIEQTVRKNMRGPDIVRMPSMGQKRTISGMRTISEGHKIPMVVMLFITP